MNDDGIHTIQGQIVSLIADASAMAAEARERIPTVDEIADQLIASTRAGIVERRHRMTHPTYGPLAGRCLACSCVCDPDERDCPRCGEPAIHAGEITWDDQHAYAQHARRQEARG